MGSVNNPNPWSPNETYKDCSQGICSIYCQQWCDIVFPPPPPFGLEDGDHSGFQFSPLIVAVIGILASAFVLVCYYTIISKYCRRRGNHDSTTELMEHRDLLDNEPSQASSRGLDEALIKSIAVCKYKKGEGLVEGTDCSVCLSEFQENESLRLLPECNHAFHLPCIDTWLKANSSCPLCRSNIASTNSLHSQAVPPQQTPPAPRRSALQYQHANDTTLEIQELGGSAQEEAVVSIESNVTPKTSIQSAGQRDTSERRDHVVEIRQEGLEAFRRPLPMNYSGCQRHVSIAEISRTSKNDGEYQSEISEIGSSKGLEENLCTANEKRGVLVSDRSIPGMKRSISTGGFKFTRYGKGDNSVNPN